jgi:hypothetical protein
MEDWKLNGRPMPGFLPFPSEEDDKGSLFAQIVFDGAGMLSVTVAQEIFWSGVGGAAGFWQRLPPVERGIQINGYIFCSLVH